jgi:hypothetical protein
MTARMTSSASNRQQTLAALHQRLSELPNGAVVLAEDETHVNLLPWVRATWIATGSRQQVMTPGKNRRRTIFGAIAAALAPWSVRHHRHQRVPYQEAEEPVSRLINAASH